MCGGSPTPLPESVLNARPSRVKGKAPLSTGKHSPPDILARADRWLERRRRGLSDGFIHAAQRRRHRQAKEAPV
jgi:hypothetical protein